MPEPQTVFGVPNVGQKYSSRPAPAERKLLGFMFQPDPPGLGDGTDRVAPTIVNPPLYEPYALLVMPLLVEPL